MLPRPEHVVRLAPRGVGFADHGGHRHALDLRDLLPRPALVLSLPAGGLQGLLGQLDRRRGRLLEAGARGAQPRVGTRELAGVHRRGRVRQRLPPAYRGLLLVQREVGLGLLPGPARTCRSSGRCAAPSSSADTRGASGGRAGAPSCTGAGSGWADVAAAGGVAGCSPRAAARSEPSSPRGADRINKGGRSGRSQAVAPAVPTSRTRTSRAMRPRRGRGRTTACGRAADWGRAPCGVRRGSGRATRTEPVRRWAPPLRKQRHPSHYLGYLKKVVRSIV